MTNVTFSIGIVDSAQNAIADGELNRLYLVFSETGESGYAPSDIELIVYAARNPTDSIPHRLKEVFPDLFAADTFAKAAGEMNNDDFNDFVSERLEENEAAYLALKDYTAKYIS